MRRPLIRPGARRALTLGTLALLSACATYNYSSFLVGRAPADFLRPTAISFVADTPYGEARADLGRRLFHDPQLSGDGTRSCASCHDPAMALPFPLGNGDGAAMTWDTLVIGAGLAGSAAATHLAAAGQKVVLVDRERGPSHKVCGEFLSGPAVAHLRAFGVDPAAMGGVPIRRLRLANGARMAEAPLPFTAYGLSRLRLDSALRARATEKGAALRLGAPVRRLDDARAVLADGQALAAKRIVLATGKHDLSDRRRVPLDGAGMVGFKLHLRLAPQQADALADCIELHFFQGGYAGLQRIEGGLANLSFVIDDAGFARAGRSFPGALAAVAPVGSLLAERLAGHQPEWQRPLAL